MAPPAAPITPTAPGCRQERRLEVPQAGCRVRWPSRTACCDVAGAAGCRGGRRGGRRRGWVGAGGRAGGGEDEGAQNLAEAAEAEAREEAELEEAWLSEVEPEVLEAARELGIRLEARGEGRHVHGMHVHGMHAHGMHAGRALL